MTAPVLQPGSVVADRFEVLAEAGRGAMGTVWRAHDRASDRQVALKVIQVGRNPSLRDRFEREARALAGLDHERIVRYVAHSVADDDPDRLFLAMEWLDGEDLEHHLERGPLSSAATLELGTAIAEALAAAEQRQVIHRDVKPSNIFLRGGAIAQAMLIDFGLARLAGQHDLTASGMMIGTPAYMAPEHTRSGRLVDGRSDIFSLGSVLYRCLAGRPPFTGGDLFEILARLVFDEPPPLTELGVPPALAALIQRMLAKNPEERPADARALAAALREVAAGDGPAFASRPRLSRGEQRLVCFVLARTGHHPGEQLGSTVAYGTDEPDHGLRALALRYGATVRRLPDDTLAAMLSGVGSATDLAASAARFALALRVAIPGTQIALATGRGVVDGGLVIGEAIERTAALMRLEPAGDGVRVDDLTAGLLGPRFELGGDRHGLVLRADRGAPVALRELRGKQTTFVGRDRELAAMTALFDEAASEPGARAAVVLAPPGAGKSRLRHELLEGLRRRGGSVEIWQGRCDVVGSGSALASIADALRHGLGLSDDVALEVRRRRLAARVARHVAEPERTRVTEFIGELIGTPFPDDSVALHSARRDHRLMADQAERAWLDLVTAEAAAQPLVLVLEDLHWGDATTFTYVDAALRECAEQPLFVLALARPELTEQHPGLWGKRAVSVFHLPPLPRRAGAALVTEALGADVPAAIVSELVERAAGNAFFLEELIRAAAAGHTTDLPQTVLAMLQARIEQLPAEERRMLRLAAIFGETFWRDGVLALAGAAAETVDAALASLSRAELIIARRTSRYPDQHELGFRHALMRDAAYSLLTDADRRLGHRLAAEWLEACGESDGMILGEHLARGADAQQDPANAARAAAACCTAAARALGAADLDGALSLCTRGLVLATSAGARGRLLAVQAEAYRWKGQWEDAQRTAEAALAALPPGDQAWWDAVHDASYAAGMLGRRQSLEALHQQTRGVAEPADAAAREAQVRALSRLAVQLILDSHPAGEEVLTRVESIARERPLAPILEAQVINARADVHLMAGDLETFLELEDRAASLFEQADDRRNATLFRGYVAYAAGRIGANQLAERTLHVVIAQARRLGMVGSVIRRFADLAHVLWRRGDLVEARRVAAEALELATATGSAVMQVEMECLVNEIEHDTGALEQAERGARATLARIAAVQRPSGHVMTAFAVLARVLLTQGRSIEALEVCTQAMAELDALGRAEQGEREMRLVHAEVLWALDRPDLARSLIATICEQVTTEAARIRDPELRRGFLEGVPSHARALRLAGVWNQAV